jgi:FkbM family methyltransferase
MGLDVHRIGRGGIDARRLQMMRLAGIRTVLDVGANQGQYGRLLRQGGYGGRIVSFEPLSDAFAQLLMTAHGDASWTCRNLALGESEDSATLHVAANSWSSSLLPMDARLVEAAPSTAHVRDEVVTVAPLDAAVADLRPNVPTFLKIDTQGSEMSVLRGAVATLEHTPLIEVEVSVAGLYVGQPLYNEVLSHLGNRGYGLVALAEEFTDPRTGALLEFNAILARPDFAGLE